MNSGATNSVPLAPTLHAPETLQSRLSQFRFLGLAIGVAFVARILYWLLATPRYVPRSDADQYQQLATNIARGRGFSLYFPQLDLHQTAFRPPLYPFALAGWYRVFGNSIVAGRVFSLCAGVAAVALTWLLLRKVSGTLAATVGALAVAVYPPLLANDTAILTEPLSLALLAGMLLALASKRWAVGASLCGLLILSRPSAQFLLVLLVLWVLWQFGWKRCLAFGAIAAVVVSPWVVRNWVVMGAPVLVTSNGFNAAAMYSPQARETGGFVDPVFDERFSEFRLSQFDEIEWQQKLQALAVDSLKAHPNQVVAVLRKNTLAYFEIRPSNNRSAEELDGRNMRFRNLMLPLFYLVTVAGIFGLAVHRREPIVLLLIGISSYFVASSLFIVAPPRLRAPFDWCCCIGLGLAVSWLASRRERSRPPVTSACTTPVPSG